MTQTEMQSYSQYGEDRAIVELFGDHVGRFLDIGAWHPTVFSNTRALFERGWSGVMVEPSPGPFLNLLRACSSCGDVPLEFYGDRWKTVNCEKCGSGLRYGTDPRVTLILGAVGVEPCIVRLHATDDALSTSDHTNFEKWKGTGGFYGEFMTPVVTLSQIFNQLGGFDFINFDAEGCSVELFVAMLGLGSYPTCVCLEHDGRSIEVQQLAARKGYRTVEINGTNLVLARAA